MTLISLISEQTLPNLLFIRANPGVERHIFLSTDRMERQGRSEWIRRAAGLDQVEVERVPPEDMAGIWERLAQLTFGPEERILLHLTGGTKMMALAAYQFFTTQFRARTRVFYLALETGRVQEVFPEAASSDMPTQVSLDTYLAAHGVEMEHRGLYDFLAWGDLAEETFRHMTGLRWSPKIAKKMYLGTSIPDPAERKFYTGEWLEVWAYHQLRAHLGLATDAIRQGVHLHKQAADGQSFAREYDVVFIRNNHLYLLEVKAWPGAAGFSTQKANPDLYKLAQAKRELGLYAGSLFWTINRPSPAALRVIGPNLELLGIQFAGPDTLSDPDTLRHYLQKL
ncbi:MAG: hypothetical protein OHK0039_10350 [Bacteroidia bacterium]